jgi:periplasmic divalent cation tolerance protein
MTLVAVVTTLDSRDDARRIAAALVQRRLVACAQISEIESFYTWEGAVQHEAEFRLLLKTTAAQRAAVQAALLEMHPYDLPAIHTLELHHVHAPYAAWVEEQSAGPPPQT